MTILLTTILVVPLMLIIGGLAVDLGALGVLKGKLQVAADAGATAGASSITFVKDVPECLVDCTGTWAANLAVAEQYATLNGSPDPDVSFTPAEPPTVRVAVARSIPTSFLRLLGINSLSSAAVARAARRNITQADKDAEPGTPGRSALVQ